MLIVKYKLFMKNDVQHNDTQHNGRVLLCSVSAMLNVANKLIMLSVSYAECRN
jgi:hypothetical protein